jgi:hypothetical protein
MKQILAAALLLVGATACGSSNNIKQFIVATSGQQTVAGPNADCPTTDPKVKTVPFNNDGTFTIFEGQKDKWYLDLGRGNTIEGTLANGTYSFSGSSLRDSVEPSLANKQFEVKELGTVQISLKVDGNTVTGSFNSEQKKTCDNLSNGTPCKAAGEPTASGNTLDCLSTGTLSGIQLDDPQYKYQTSTPGTP